MEGGLIDWSAPWLQDWRTPGEQVAGRVLDGRPVHQALNAQLHRVDGMGGEMAPVRFTPQQDLPPGRAYERHIFDTGTCPCRDTLHDFFNGLVWLRLPLAKARLNALQAEQIAARGIGQARGPVRDAITIFDENGALLDAPEPLWQALLARRWTELFVELRPLWNRARLLVFGHALLEKLVAPRKDMTAHVWRGPAPIANGPDAGHLDAWLAQQFTEAALAAKPFTPLPVLGVPGWWSANQADSFYDDPLVFRPARSQA